jgi:eukaryotic-like serine/threonine-protein kinase
MDPAVHDPDTLFARAIEIASSEERAQFLEQACGDDAELRREVEKLVCDHFRAGAFLERPAAHVVAIQEAAAESPGMVLGPYKLLEQIGEGGFGVVFMAEQTQPIRRKVALKIVKPGMDTRQVIARFDVERQALALMDHPNIAHVFDGGQTASGRPYFVMELVRGISITDFCDKNQLPVRARLDLFVTVCQAIQHAHHKGIIHRDVKPTNVLVTLHDGTPVAKVIDFGIAKALDQQLTDKTLFTNFAQMLGTPLYMSPEQAELSGRDVDTRSDIYALGVLLYELLTGTTPFDKERLQSLGYDEICRIIREQEPPRPSARVSTLGQAAATVSMRRQSDPRRLSRLFRGDLDWIVMKALEKDRDRRYDTASALAADVQRYLADEPVLASPPSLRYRLRRFVRKYRGPVLAASVILVLLVGGIIGTSLGLLQAEHQRQIAEEKEETAQKEKRNALASAAAERQAKQNEAAERKKAEAAQRQAMEALRATTDDVVEQLIGAKPALSPVEKKFLETTLKRWQILAAEKGDDELARQIRAEGLFRVARLRAKLGEHDGALAGLREASILWGKLAADFPDKASYRLKLAVCHHNVGMLLRDLGQLAEAEAAHYEALGIQKKLAGDHPGNPHYDLVMAGSYNNLGLVFRDRAKLPEALEAHKQALTAKTKLAADFPDEARYQSELALTLNNLGLVFRDLGKRPEAEDAYRKALILQEPLAADLAVPTYRFDLARIYNDLAILLRDDPARRAEAEAAQRQALTIQDKLAGEFPSMPQYRSELALSHTNLGNLLLDVNQPDKADAAYGQALVIQEKLVADYPTVHRFHQNLALSHNNRARALHLLGKVIDAEAAYREAISIRERLAADLPRMPLYRLQLSRSQNSLGNLLLGQRKWAEAEDAYREALTIQERLAADSTMPQYRIDLGGTQVNFGRLLAKKQEPEPALEWYGKAIATLEGAMQKVKVDANARRFLRDAHWARAEALDVDLKRYAEALADWGKTVQLSPETEKARFRMRRATCLVRAGQVDAATQEAEEVAKTAGAVTLFDAACVFALAAARPDETAGSLSKEECATRAVALLRQAVAQGFNNAEHMKRDDDLTVLRQRDDFKKLLAELEKKSP